MSVEDAIAELKQKVTAVSPGAEVRSKRRSAEEAILRVYAPADDAEKIKDAVRDRTMALLNTDGLDVQVLVYDIATDLPPAE